MLRISSEFGKRMGLFPITSQIEKNDGEYLLTIAGFDLNNLATQYGTPLYIYDRATLDDAVGRYRKALIGNYPASSGLTYAGKAFLCIGIAEWATRQDLWLDCSSCGELAFAVTAHVRRENTLLHGVSKSQEDLVAALSQAGILVVDNMGELQRLANMYLQRIDSLPDLWLRLRPGKNVRAHNFIQTGQEDSKFGFSPAEFIQAVYFCLRSELPLTGLHFHLGSHFREPEPVIQALDIALDLILEIQTTENWFPSVICPGGGWGIAYHEDELPHPSIETYVHFVAEHLVRGCRQRGLVLPRLQLEPGRSLIAQAGVAIYRVEVVKRSAHRRWLLLDGGMADNLRPALYGEHYSVLPVRGLERSSYGSFSIAGPYCESGDIMIEEISLPDMSPGELVAIPVSGAYHLSMSNNYNGARKPAVLWLERGRATLIQRRETAADLMRRDLPLPIDQ